MLNYTSSLDPVFHALADPTRRHIVEALAGRTASVKAIAEPLKMSLPAVMQHLHILESDGLVTSQKQGRVRLCRLNQAPILLMDEWVGKRKASWERMFDQMEKLLAEGEDL
ncbi:MAG TPA: metalloregulator ArsR/SmtB family transcription factor [Fimbriimonadaceae bacterium]|jgi:DNA-binding transcriptional ArsR family regulator